MVVTVAGLLAFAGAILYFAFLSSPQQRAQQIVMISMAPGSWQLRSVQREGFVPETVAVVIGVNSTVIWQNDDTAVHTAHSNIPEFDSGLLQPGQTFTHTFTRPGIFGYHCDPHPWRTGTVIVKAKQG